MENKYICSNIDTLITPVGEFTITRLSDEKKIAFSVLKNVFHYPYDVLGKSNALIGTIDVDTDYEIEIPAQNLEIGEEYMISFSNGKWEYLDSDEHTDCYSTFLNGWVIGIGAYDPNDEEKQNQSWEYSKQKGYLDKNIIHEPSQFNETKFVSHVLNVLDTRNGYRFRMLEKYTVSFLVSWIKVTQFEKYEYDNALSLWLC